MRDPMNDDVARVHAEIEQRLGAVRVANEHGGEIRVGRESQARMNAVVGCGGRLQFRVSAIPVIDVLGRFEARSAASMRFADCSAAAREGTGG